MGGKNKRAKERRKARDAATNVHGLARSIPADVKRAVRQRCFFGCVRCGRLPYDYEHFEPEFFEAREHNADGIALLCPMCHRDKTAGRIRREQVKKAHAAPFNSTHNPVWTHQLPDGPLTLRVGDRGLVGTDLPITIDGRDVLRLRKDGDGRWLLSGDFKDKNGDSVLKFVDDEVVVSRGVWDVEFVGPCLTIRAGKRQVIVRAQFDAEAQVVAVDLPMNKMSLMLPDTGDAVHINVPGVVEGLHISNSPGVRVRFDKDGVGIGAPRPGEVLPQDESGKR